MASLFEDREGSLWIGTNGGGLNRLRDGAVTTIGVEEGLSGDQVRAVFQHPDGTVWVGKGGGATALRDGVATPLTVARDSPPTPSSRSPPIATARCGWGPCATA